MAGDDNFHGSVTMMPNGQIFAGSQESYPAFGLIGKVKGSGDTKIDTGDSRGMSALYAKKKSSTVNGPLQSLLAKIKSLEQDPVAMESLRLKASSSIAIPPFVVKA